MGWVAGRSAQCALCARGAESVRRVPDCMEGMCRVLLSMLEGVKGELRLLNVLKMLEGMHRLLLCIWEDVKGGRGLELEFLEVRRVMCSVLLCLLESVEVSFVC